MFIPGVIIEINEIIKFIEEREKEEKFEKILNKINELSKKLDWLILKDLKAAYELLNNALDADNLETKKNHLSSAQTLLIKYVNSEFSQNIGGYTNTDLIIIASYGLAYTYWFSKEQKLSMKYIFKLFELEPRRARTELAPEVFKKFFKPKCQEDYDWYINEKNKRNNDLNKVKRSINDFIENRTKAINEFVENGKKATSNLFETAPKKIEVGLTYAAAVGSFVASIPIGMGGNAVRMKAMAVMKKAQQEWKESNSINSYYTKNPIKSDNLINLSPMIHKINLYEINDYQDLDEQLESRLDSRCQTLAKQFLAEI
ncbi:MAG: hypothetical protein RMY29_034585 [Nostoc sp. CreGUA01]|nr:hypothetical protein [Nostoc sp. CreGUA01]